MNAPNLKKRLKLTSPLLYRATQAWDWWIDELAGILPQGIRSAALPSVERLYLEASDTEVIVRKGTSEATEEAGRYPLSEDAEPQARAMEELIGRTREINLTLPTSKVLIKSLTLPLVTETNLREVLGFEMDRQTPFTLDQVYYDHKISGRDSKANTITVDLVVTPRQYLDDLLDKLKHLGCQPHLISMHQKNGDLVQLPNLLPEEARQQKQGSARVINLILAMTALALLATTLALPLMNKRQVIETLEARVELATRKAQVVQRLGSEVEQLRTGSDFLVKKKLNTPMTLEIIDELTRILPDDTWINRLTIKGTEIQIQGFSTAAAALIPLIESSDSFHNPRFRSSVTTSNNSDSERFHLSAEVSGRAGE